MGMGGWVPKHRVAWAEAYLRAKWHLDISRRLATINMGRKFGGSTSIWEGGAGSPPNTKSPEWRPTSIPIGIVINAAIWPQQIWAENWVCAPLGEGELGPHLTQCVRGQGLPACQVHLDPSNHLATVHEGHRQTGQTGKNRQDNGWIA